MSNDARDAGHALGQLLSANLTAPPAPTIRYGTLLRTTLTAGTLLGDVQLSGGILTGIPMTTACVNAQESDRVIVQTSGHLSTVTGIMARMPLDRAPRCIQGTIVIKPTSSSTRHTLFDQNSWDAATGGWPMGDCVVAVCNGDVRALNVPVIGAGYHDDDNRWYVWLGSASATQFRVNYMIFRRW
ncbi:MAG: hypothetical protein UHD09_02410 [Bifidobacterium sp.]|nr:hypothetical protein [Bifidobacterium sp.]